MVTCVSFLLFWNAFAEISVTLYVYPSICIVDGIVILELLLSVNLVTATVFLEEVEAVMQNLNGLMFTIVPFWGRGFGVSGCLVTVKIIVSLTPLPSLAVAVIVVLPTVFAVTSPFASTDATSGFAEVKVSVLSSASSGSIVAWIWAVSPIFREVVSADN